MKTNVNETLLKVCWSALPVSMRGNHWNGRWEPPSNEPDHWTSDLALLKHNLKVTLLFSTKNSNLICTLGSLLQYDFVVDDRGEMVTVSPGIVLNIFLVSTIEIDVFFASTSLIFEFSDEINLGVVLFSLLRGLDGIEDVRDVITNRFYLFWSCTCIK